MIHIVVPFWDDGAIFIHNTYLDENKNINSQCKYVKIKFGIKMGLLHFSDVSSSF